MARGRSSDIRRELRKVIPESVVNGLARETGAVQRQRRVRIYELVWVLVLGFAIGRKRTLAALRRSYERETGQTIEESSFYQRFSPGLGRLFKKLLARAFEESLGVVRGLEGPLAGFRDVILTDSTVIRLHDLLEKRFPACRTNHTKAALKAHTIMSVRGVGEQSIKVTAEREHDGPVFCVGPWVRDHLLMFDLGYFRYQLFACIGRNGGYFLTRLKSNADPTIVAVNRVHRGRAISLVGERLRDVVSRMQRQVLDVEVEVRFPRRRYGGRVHRATQRLRVVGLLNRETREYHLYVTNVPSEKLAAEDIGAVYSLRWQIELLFKELKTHYRIEDMPSSKRVVVEVLLYAAFLTMVVSRRLLALVRRRLAVMADRIPEQRWAAVFVSVAHELLAAATHPHAAVRLLLHRLERVLLHEAVDPNAARHGLLTSVEQRTHRLHPMAAAA
jgi:putative transposase